jgi:hypothetical protein
LKGRFPFCQEAFSSVPERTMESVITKQELLDMKKLAEEIISNIVSQTEEIKGLLNLNGTQEQKSELRQMLEKNKTQYGKTINVIRDIETKLNLL